MDPAQLSDVPLFSGLDAAEIQAIASHSVTRKVARNAVLLREGERPSSLFIIQSGRVRVSVSAEDGGELVLADLGPGELFGELALIDGEPRMATVIAVEDSAISVVSREDFAHCLARNPEIGVKLLRNLVQRVRDLTDNVKTFALFDVRGRILRLLRRVARPGPGGLATGPITHQEIASMVGASREMVSRVMTGLKNDGLIRVEGRSIVLTQEPPAAH